jgi:phenylalanyl-tRNA synthetase alpha chain
MLADLENLKKQALAEFARLKNSDEVQAFRVKYLGRQGEFNKLLKNLKEIALEERPKVGQLANEVKQAIVDKLESFDFGQPVTSAAPATDLTLPGLEVSSGSLHPNTIIQYQLEDIFQSLGFRVLEGPDIESEYYNFEALNIPADHPAREMQDTFWLTGGQILKTHTSAMQVRAIQKYGAPLRAIFRALLSL